MNRGAGAFVALVIMVGTAHAQLAGWAVRGVEQACPHVESCMKQTRRRFSRTGGEILLGAGYRSLYGVPYGVATADFLVGAELRRAALYGQFGLEAGGPDSHLPIIRLHLGFTPEAKLGRVRLGGGVGYGVIVIRRATNASLAGGPTFTARAIGSVDLYASGNRALILGVDAGLEVDLFLAEDRDGRVNDTTATVTGFLGARL